MAFVNSLNKFKGVSSYFYGRKTQERYNEECRKLNRIQLNLPYFMHVIYLLQMTQ